MIKGLYFDLDGIYFNKGLDVFIQNLSATYALSQTTLSALMKRSAEVLDYKRGKLSGKEFFEYVSKVMKSNIPESEYLEEMVAGFVRNVDARNFLVKVKSEGYKTLACSNIFKELVQMLDLKFSFLKDFDVKVFSYEVGALKPDKKMFEVLIERAKLDPSEILYLEDDKESFDMAESLGFIAVHGDRLEIIRSRLGI